MSKFQTKQHGYNDDEVKSALQKEIRRGNEEDAMYWALELTNEYIHYKDDGKSTFSWLLNRLYIITYEDIGIGDPDVVLQVTEALKGLKFIMDKYIDDLKRYEDKQIKNKPRDEWMMVLSYIILLMCRAKKSRITDHFKEYMKFYWEEQSINNEEFKVKIPDYALDMHTTQGNKMGRHKGSHKGVEHFIKDGEQLENENPEIKDIYKDNAHKVWRLGK